VSVKNEQALHLYKMHHVMAHIPLVIFTVLLATEMLASRKDRVKEVRLPESTY